MRPRPRFWRFAFAAAAVAGALAIPGLPAVASAATPAAAGAASTTCATSRPHSGTILYSKIRGGLGSLTIKNGSQDGVVVLVLGRTKAFGVYIRDRSKTTVGNIKPGTYTVYFTTGSRFSVCQGRFTSGASYWRFNTRVTFVALPHYTVETLTLYEVSGGNAPTTQINPGDFPAP